MTHFPCSQCGLCCKNIPFILSQIPPEIKNIPELHFPYKYPNGICENLNQDNSCKIYTTRPTICNGDKIIKLFKLNKISQYKTNAKLCNSLIISNNLDEKYLINIDKIT